MQVSQKANPESTKWKQRIQYSTGTAIMHCKISQGMGGVGNYSMCDSICFIRLEFLYLQMKEREKESVKKDKCSIGLFTPQNSQAETKSHELHLILSQGQWQGSSIQLIFFYFVSYISKNLGLKVEQPSLKSALSFQDVRFTGNCLTSNAGLSVILC